MVKKPKLFIALCTLPALILTVVFMIVPMLNAIYLSFTSSTALSVGFNSKFVFLDNYIYMFKDKDFVQALFNPGSDDLSEPGICFYPYTGRTPGEIFLSYGILFPECCLYDGCWDRMVFCI